MKAEVEGENLGGKVEYEEQELVKNLKLKNGLEMSELKKQTLLDESLETCRKLAEDNRQGYLCKDNVLMRSRMNDIGEQVVQIVLPKSHRDRILTLSHEKCGHFGHRSWPKTRDKRQEDRAYIQSISKMRENEDVETFLEALFT